MYKLRCSRIVEAKDDQEAAEVEDGASSLVEAARDYLLGAGWTLDGWEHPTSGDETPIEPATEEPGGRRLLAMVPGAEILGPPGAVEALVFYVNQETERIAAKKREDDGRA